MHTVVGFMDMLNRVLRTWFVTCLVYTNFQVHTVLGFTDVGSGCCLTMVLKNCVKHGDTAHSLFGNNFTECSVTSYLLSALIYMYSKRSIRALSILYCYACSELCTPSLSCLKWCSAFSTFAFIGQMTSFVCNAFSALLTAFFKVP